MPFWHEAELGALASRNLRVPAEKVLPEFQVLRWPSDEEARLHGFASVKAWCIRDRAGRSVKISAEQETELEAEYRLQAELRAPKGDEKEELAAIANKKKGPSAPRYH